MLTYLEIKPTCVSCDACRAICPEKSILFVDHVYSIEAWSCTMCYLCVEVCPVEAIKERKLEINSIVT